nr:hypothetical protein [uncultured Mediterraneibacter sp.]
MAWNHRLLCKDRSNHLYAGKYVKRKNRSSERVWSRSRSDTGKRLYGGGKQKAEELAETLPGAFLVGQGFNPNNPAMHIKTTGPEIWRDLDGKADIFVAAIGPAEPCKVLDQSIYQEVIAEKDEDAYETARNCARTEGVSIGISAGAILWAEIRVAKRPENEGKNIVFVFPDKGERYLPSGLYE